MKKIKKINLYNYRAFYSATSDVYTIDLLGGKNLIIYGENGSGKSSIFDGLRDFFLSSVSKIEFNHNIYSIGSIPDEPYIEVEFTDELHSFFFSTDEYRTNNNEPFIKDTNKAKSFLSYKNLLAIHYFKPKTDINIFDILFGENGILNDYQNPAGNPINETDLTLGTLYDNIIKFSSERRNSTNFKKIKGNASIVNDFNLGVTTALKKIIKNTNKFLRIFNQEFYLIKFEYNPLVFNDVKDVQNRLSGAKLKPILFFYKKHIDNYNSFLNEARLTALSLSIYFSAIKTIPPPLYRIIFLDDVFVGLDTGNRIPLLNIIDEIFLKDYQIIITTYDRYWFEIAKDQLGTNKWQTAEMYIKNNTKFFYPIIIQPSKDYYNLAIKYFDAKDYPACGNYQRKACEKHIKEFIPRKMQLQYNQDDTVIEVDLETLFNGLVKYLTENGLDAKPFINFPLYKRLILNTLSHDDLKSSYYKSELEEMFKILDELRKLNRQIIVKSDDLIFFETLDNSGNFLKFDIKALDNLVLLTQGRTKKYQKSKFTTINIHFNGVGNDFPSDVDNLPRIYKNICHYLKIPSTGDAYSAFKDIKGNLLSSF